MRKILIVLILLVTPAAAIGVSTLWGPVSSGAVLLALHLPGPPVPHDLPSSYEPLHQGHVDSGTGIYFRQDEDLVLPGTPPFVLRRTYRSGDPVSREFGVGATHNGEWYLRGDPDDLWWAELILEDSMRIDFQRSSPGRSVSNAMFVHTEDTSEYYGARLGWVGMFWAMRLNRGDLLLFTPCGHPSTTCSIVKRRDADGHWIHFRRDRSGVLEEIVAGEARIALTYDKGGRISRAEDSTGHSVDYGYDQGGRLIKVTSSEGANRSYTYGSGGEMLTIEEQGLFIQNTYEDGRCVRQQIDIRHKDGTMSRQISKWAYTIRNDRIVATEVSRSNGSRSRYEFTERGYHTTETLQDAFGRRGIVTLHRDPATLAVKTLHVSCFPGRQNSTEPLAGRSIEQATEELLRTCW